MYGRVTAVLRTGGVIKGVNRCVSSRSFLHVGRCRGGLLVKPAPHFHATVSGRGFCSDSSPSPSVDMAMVQSARSGASMAELVSDDNDVLTPQEALDSLVRGNARFYMNKADRPEMSALERRTQIASRAPYAAVFGCSDSRVPIEILFDESLGGIYTMRVAGNYVDTMTRGACAYMVDDLNIKLILVMGHEGCGAVKSAQLPEEDRAKLPEDLKYLLERISRPLEAHPHLKQMQDGKARDREAIVINTYAQARQVMQVEEVREKVEAGELMVKAAYYEITSGVVDILSDDGFMD